MKNKLIAAIMLVIISAAMCLPAFAQGFDSTALGSVSVRLSDPESGEPIAGAELSLYYAATVKLNSLGNLAYTFTPEFESCGAAINDPSLIRVLGGYVSSNLPAAAEAVTDADGKARFSALPLGLYFVKQTGAVKGYSDCRSFLVTVPYKTDGGYQYDVNASPKTEVEKLVDITVKKVWNTDDSTPITDSVTVQLVRDGNIVATATLNGQNNWSTVFEDMPKSDAYTIVEQNVPKGFTATYTQNGLEFTVTNTASLIDTGQLVWPIPILALAGMFFVAVGAVLLRRTNENNG